MDIKYLGHSSFFLRTKDAKVVTDPFDSSMIGFKFPKVEADIITISHHHHDHDMVNLVQTPADGGAPLVVDMPGEIEKKGVRVYGFQSYHDKKKGLDRGENILFKISDEELSVLHCGDVGLVLDDDFVDQIGEVDVLLIPVGGFYTIGSSEAVELCKKIEPHIVIPMHYNHPKLDQKVFQKLSPVDEFTKKMGAEQTTPVPKLTVKKDQLGDEMRVVVMEITS